MALNSSVQTRQKEEWWGMRLERKHGHIYRSMPRQRVWRYLQTIELTWFSVWWNRRCGEETEMKLFGCLTRVTFFFPDMNFGVLIDRCWIHRHRKLEEKESWATGERPSVGTYWICAWGMLNGFSHVQLFVTLWTVACRTPLPVGFCRQEYWSGLPLPSPGDLPNPWIEPMFLKSPALAGGFFTIHTTWEAPIYIRYS